MAQVLPAAPPQEPAPKSAKTDAPRKGKAATPEAVAVLSLFFG